MSVWLKCRAPFRNLEMIQSKVAGFKSAAKPEHSKRLANLVPADLAPAFGLREACFRFFY